MAKNTKPTGPGAAAQPSGDDAHGRQATETPAQPSDDAQESQPDAKPAACPCRRDCRRGKLHSFDWLADIPGDKAASDIVEVQFKNTRKGYFRNTTNLPLGPGDLVAVEAAPGHDIGTVTLTGALAELRMKRAAGRNTPDPKRVFRLAKPVDIEKYEEAKAREDDTMIRARKIAESLGLNMKIGDVEYQGDGNKAIFYYIADERVDFRQLIKILAETFKVRIEMKQIGARQEAGRIGGIGPCGRPLCCSQWMSNFVSVATSAARFQDISLNPQKLAGQCAKLKCCLNFETPVYAEAAKEMPHKDIALETKENTYYLFKADILARKATYSTDKRIPANLVTIDARRAFEIIALNKQGVKPDSLLSEGQIAEDEQNKVVDLAEQESLTRFDKSKKKGSKKQVARQKGAKPEAKNQSAARQEKSQGKGKGRGHKNHQNKNNAAEGKKKNGQ